MNAENGVSGILVPVQDAGAGLAFPIRTLLRDRSQNYGLLADREFSTDEVFLSHATTLADVLSAGCRQAHSPIGPVNSLTGVGSATKVCPIAQTG